MAHTVMALYNYRTYSYGLASDYYFCYVMRACVDTRVYTNSCTHVFTPVYTFFYTRVYTHTYTHVHTHAYTRACTDVYMDICVDMCADVCIGMSADTWTEIFVGMCSQLEYEFNFKPLHDGERIETQGEP